MKDIMWLTADGGEMTEPQWAASHVQWLGVRLAGDVLHELDEYGEPIVGDTLVYLLNAAPVSIDFALPAFVERPQWKCLVDTFDASREGQTFEGGYAIPLEIVQSRCSECTRQTHPRALDLSSLQPRTTSADPGPQE